MHRPVQQRWRATDRCTPIERDERGKPLQAPPSSRHGHCKSFPDERSPVATRGTVHYMKGRSPSARPGLMRNGTSLCGEQPSPSVLHQPDNIIGGHFTYPKNKLSDQNVPNDTYRKSFMVELAAHPGTSPS